MSVIESTLRFTTTHEWVQGDAPGTVTVGISEHAQSLLGDLVFIDLPELGTVFAAGDDMAVLESVKTAADVYAPLSGEVVAVNATLADEPGLVNQSPYEGGWLVKIKTDQPIPHDLLLQADYVASLDKA